MVCVVYIEYCLTEIVLIFHVFLHCPTTLNHIADYCSFNDVTSMPRTTNCDPFTEITMFLFKIIFFS